MSEMITCNFCNKTETIDSFQLFNGKLNGKKCLECISIYNKNKNANATDEEKLAKSNYLKQWKANNRERKRELNRNWKKANPDKVNAQRRKEYAASPEKDIAYALNWAKNNRGRVAHTARKYYATKNNATPAWLTVSQLEEMRGFYHFASIFGLEVDHIYPIKGKTVTGLHVPWNLQILSRPKNSSKGNRMPSVDMLSPYVEYLPVTVDENGFAQMEIAF
jgi:hypothetical protein